MFYSNSSSTLFWVRTTAVSIAFAIVTLLSPGISAKEVRRVAVFEQWPSVSQLITYRDRVWFVNSKPFEDSNVADVYSYSIKDDSLRYERSLFSQDLGDPVVHDGLLYWPFEDPRRSAGSGEYVVTDGVNWQWHVMQSGSVMHVHAMEVCGGDLVATTGSWTGQLHRLRSSEQDKVSENVTENQPKDQQWDCLLYTSPSPRDATLSRMPSSA